MPRYRKKPLVIEAEQFWPDCKPWPAGVCHGIDEHHWQIWTLEGPLGVIPGDYIITGIKGECYPCKSDIFESSYEAVE